MKTFYKFLVALFFAAILFFVLVCYLSIKDSHREDIDSDILDKQNAIAQYCPDTGNDYAKAICITSKSELNADSKERALLMAGEK